MAWIRTIDEDDADEGLSTLYGAMLDPAAGKVDHVLKVHSLSPKGLRAHFELYRAVMAGTKTLRKADREMIAVVVSVLNECHY
jgi:alkylhydroperoxidase family enzyme